MMKLYSVLYMGQDYYADDKLLVTYYTEEAAKGFIATVIKPEYRDMATIVEHEIGKLVTDEFTKYDLINDATK